MIVFPTGWRWVCRGWHIVRVFVTLGDILRNFLRAPVVSGIVFFGSSTIAVQDDQGQSPNNWSDDHTITRPEVLDYFYDAMDETQSLRLACSNSATNILIYHDRRELRREPWPCSYPWLLSVYYTAKTHNLRAMNQRAPCRRCNVVSAKPCLHAQPASLKPTGGSLPSYLYHRDHPVATCLLDPP
jgi:hypothetical protein